MNGTFQDEEAKGRTQAECNKRNAAILKTHPLRWKPLWNQVKGWHPALRPAVEAHQNKPRRLAGHPPA